MRAAGAIVHRQDQHARVRLPRRDRQPALRSDAQSVGADRTSGGSSGGSAAAVAAGLVELVHRIRRRRLDPHSVGGVRPPRLQAHATVSCRTATTTRRRGARSRRAARWRARSPRSRTRSMWSRATPIATSLSFDLAGSFVDAAAQATLSGVRIIWSPTLGLATPDAEMVAACSSTRSRCSSNTARASSRRSTRCSSEPPVRSWFPRAAAGSLRTASLDPMPWDGRFLPGAQFIARLRRVGHRRVSSSTPSRARIAPISMLAALFERADVLVTPAMATVAPRIGEPSPYGPGWASDYTLAFNLVRAPAAVVPCGTLATDDGESGCRSRCSS